MTNIKKLQKVVIACSIILFLLGNLSKLNIIDLDLFHQLSLFRELLNSGKFPYQDVFSYTPTKSPVIHHEWGFGAFLYILIFGLKFDTTVLLIFRYAIYFLIIVIC